MDAETLRRKALAGRQKKVRIGEAVFTLTAPTRQDGQLLYERAAAAEGGDFNRAARLTFLRQLVLKSVTGWTGVRVRDVLPEHEGNEPLPFDPDCVEVLLDANEEWESKLASEALDTVAERKSAADTAAKN